MTTPREPRRSPRRGPPGDRPRGGRPSGGRPAGRRDDAGPREPVVDDRPPVLRSIQKVRTPHGTRVARRITCTACGASDTIDFAPRDPSEVLCRKCAFAQRGVVDPDDAAARTLQLTCLQCRRAFERVVDPADPHDSRPPLCNDCKHGVETQQQDRAKGATRVSAKVVRARPRPKA